MHDDYKRLDYAPDKLERCPVCHSAAELWQYSESETAPRKLLGMCSNGEKIGPQEGFVHQGCPLYMPGDNFYRETIRDAARYWNEFARAIEQMRAAGEQHQPVAEVIEGGVHDEATEARIRWLFNPMPPGTTLYERKYEKPHE